jgi:hypothetical protein
MLGMDKREDNRFNMRRSDESLVADKVIDQTCKSLAAGATTRASYAVSEAVV